MRVGKDATGLENEPWTREDKTMNFRTTRHIFSLTISISLFAALLVSDLPRAEAAAGGAFDNTFDGNGRLATDFEAGTDVAESVAIQADGKIVAVGYGTASNGLRYIAVARYNTNGSLDTTFSGDGKLLATTAGSGGFANDVAIQPDGKILVAGGETGSSGGVSISGVLLRYTTNGVLDTTFSGDGILDGGTSYNTSIAVGPDNKIVVAGALIVQATSVADWRVRRFTSAGEPDTTFSGDGRIDIDFGGNSNEVPRGIAVLPNGKTLVGGTANPGGTNFALALLTTNGSLDTGFDGDGKVITDLPGTTSESVNDMKVQGDGKIILAGSSGLDTAFVRYNANGTLDNTFDGDGILITDIVGNSTDQARSVAVQANGKIVAVCTSGPADFYVLRLNQDGSRDADFGNNGLVVSDMTNGSTDRSFDLAIQSNGKIVVAGSTQNTASVNFCLARYLPGDGSTDFDFDGDGKTDIAIFRPNGGSGSAEWWWRRSSDGLVPALQFGAATDIIAPGDFTGDGKMDITVFRPSTGTWFVLRSEDYSFFSFPFGATGDVPVTGDYDGDGKADPAVFRASFGQWFIQRSSDSQVQIDRFGSQGDVPVTADYDGDGKDDIGIYRPNLGGQWWINRSTEGLITVTFGTSTDKAVPGDYTGDGKADIALFRPSNGIWFVLRSENLSFFSFPFGANGDVPSPGDYDGDGLIDAAVFRPSSATWFIQGSTSGTTIQQFGSTGDVPVPNAFVR